MPLAELLRDTDPVSHVRRVAAFAASTLLAATAIACAGPATTPNPATSARPGTSASPASANPAASPTPPIPGLSWEKAPDVERPTDAFAEPSAEPSGPSGPGTAGHPGHFPGQAIVDDVVATGDGLTAVGYVGIDGVWTAIAWRSGDGGRWTLESIDDAPASFAVAVAADLRTGRVYAAGRSGPDPVVWAATGGGWTRAGIPTLSGGAERERAVAIVATRDGLLAGGSVGPELGDRRARFWCSTDGAVWAHVPDDPAFAGAEVVAIEPLASGGSSRSAISGPASGAQDRSPGARTTASLAAGRRPGARRRLANALATDADGSLVAVGSDLDEREAVVWRSTDGGATWQRAPREDSRLYEPYKIRMTDVVATPGGLVAVGNYVGLQYGTAARLAATSWNRGRGARTTRARPGRDARGRARRARPRRGRQLRGAGQLHPDDLAERPARRLSGWPPAVVSAPRSPTISYAARVSTPGRSPRPTARVTWSAAPAHPPETGRTPAARSRSSRSRRWRRS